MCRILDKLSGIPGTHTVSGILSDFAVSFLKRGLEVPRIILTKSSQLWCRVNHPHVMVNGTVCDGLTFKRGAIPAVLASPPPPIQRASRDVTDL